MMLVATLLMLATLLFPSTPFSTTEFLKDAVNGTWESAPPKAVTLFLCSEEPLRVMKDMSGLSFTVKLTQPPYWFDALDSVKRASPLRLHTLVIDHRCSNTDKLLQKASELALTRSPYRWIVLNVTVEEQSRESCQRLASEISANGGVLAEGRATDADVVVVCRGPSSLILVDLWGPISPTILGNWSPDVPGRFESDRRPPASRRLTAGLDGYLFRAAFVITNNDTYDHLTDGVNKQYDFMTKFNYEIWHIVTKMLNATLEKAFVKVWGHNDNGTWTGMIGLQVHSNVEIGGTPTAITEDRLAAQIFLNYQTPVMGIFVFKEPPMSYIYNIFTRPFPKSLWLSIVGMVSLGALLLYGVLRVELMTGVHEHLDMPRIAEGRKRRLEASWSDVALLSFGAVCQQGSPTEARGVPGRIVTLFLFLGILFLYTSYSASIVALLQSTTSNIHHYKDFLGSRITLGVQNVSYNIYYMKTANDTYRRRVFLEKLTNYGRRNPFMSLEEGLKKMRSSYFAFFATRPNMYQSIADTFEEQEKCGLREVENFVAVSNPHLTVSKWSTHAEVIRIALRKIQERGIRQRQLQKFFPFKPVCVNQGGNFQSVSLIDCYAAFVVLGGGFGISCFLLLAENLLRFVNSCRLKRKY